MQLSQFSPRHKTSFLAAAALAALLSLSACGKDTGAGGAKGDAQGPVAAQAQPALTVELVPVLSADVAETVSASGNVMPWQEAVVGLEVGGMRVTRVFVNVGDEVKKGQRLVTLDASVARAESAAMAASLAEAKTAEAQALSTLERARRLSGAGGVSEQDLSQMEAQHATAQARVRAATAQMDIQRQKLAFTTLVAPDDGVISSRTAAEGAVAPAGSEMLRLIRQGRLEWRAEVSAEHILSVSPGQSVSLESPVGTVRGTVRQVAPTVDLSTRAGLVYVDLPTSASVKAGMYLSGQIAGELRPTAQVPVASIVARDGKSFVFKVSDTQRAQAVEVEVGRTHGLAVAVTGVAAGDQVVGQGAGFLKDGDLVRVAVTAEGAN